MILFRQKFANRYLSTKISHVWNRLMVHRLNTKMFFVLIQKLISWYLRTSPIVENVSPIYHSTVKGKCVTENQFIYGVTILDTGPGLRKLCLRCFEADSKKFLEMIIGHFTKLNHFEIVSSNYVCNALSHSLKLIILVTWLILDLCCHTIRREYLNNLCNVGKYEQISMTQLVRYYHNLEDIVSILSFIPFWT